MRRVDLLKNEVIINMEQLREGGCSGGKRILSDLCGYIGLVMTIKV